MIMGQTSPDKIEPRAIIQDDGAINPGDWAINYRCRSNRAEAERPRLFGGYVQFRVRSHDLKEGQERTRHIGVRPPNEHSLYFGKLGVQFMHRDLAVSPSRGDYTLGQQGDPDAGGHTAQNRIDRAEFQGLRNEYACLAQQTVQLYSI